MDFLARLLLSLAALYFTLYGLTHLRARAIAEGGTTAFDTPPPVASSTIPFVGDGLITYFREGDGHIDPYLVFSIGSSTQTKILNFSDRACSTAASCPHSVSQLRARYGTGPIHVQGFTQNEELYVRSITAGRIVVH